VALALNYEKYRQRTLAAMQLENTGWLLLSLLLVIGAGVGTCLAINSRSASGVAVLCGVLTLVFILATGMTLSDLLAAKAERPADMQTVHTLMHLVDQLGNRQEFVDEIAILIKDQGELYQFQALALILATKNLGISPEEMATRSRPKMVSAN